MLYANHFGGIFSDDLESRSFSFRDVALGEMELLMT